MDATLITAGALVLALLVVVLLLIHLNRRAVKYRETETFPAFESGIQRENFFSQEPPAQTAQASSLSAADTGVEELVVEKPEEAHDHAEATVPVSVSAAERSNLSEDAAFEAAFDAPPKLLSDAGPAWGHPVPRSADPAASLVRKLVEGQGSLSGDELHRMELYRADRLLAAIGSLEEEFGGKKNENRRKRLQRLRQYAETLQQRPDELEEAETMETPAGQDLTTAPGLSPDASPDASPDSSPDSPEATVVDKSEKAAAEPELAEPEPAETGDTGAPKPDAVSEPEPMWESWEEESEPTQETELLSESGGAPFYLEEESDEAVYPSPVVGEEEADWPFEAPAEDISTPAAPEVEFADIAQAAEEAAPESVIEESAAEPIAEEAVTAEEWVVAEEAAPAEPLAEEAAPAEEDGALAGLSTEELSGILASVSDKSIRIAAIDRLVEQPSSEGLQALYQCLEDADPEVQLHALEAAEKLLARSAAE